MGNTLDDLDELNSCNAELILLGHIANKMSLISTYKHSITADDFSGSETKKLWLTLMDYDKQYPGSEMEETEFNAVYLLAAADPERLFYGEYRQKPFKLVREVRKLGGDVAADNEAFRTVSKMSLLRKLRTFGYNVKRITERSDFRDLTANNIRGIVYCDMEDVMHGGRLSSCDDFTSGVLERAKQLLLEPEAGVQTPLGFINHHMHGFCPNDLILIGANTNCGKGRFLMNLLVWMVAHEGQTVCLVSNEMTGSDFFRAMLCTVSNMLGIHEHELKLPQSDIVQSRYKDEKGKIVELNHLPTCAERDAYLLEKSPDYRKYQAVLQWWEEHFDKKFFFVNVTDDYSPERIKQKYHLAKLRGCTVFAYDTLKSYQSLEWQDLVLATTALSELIKSDPDGMIGLATFQLTSDALSCDPFELCEKHIAHSRSMLHLPDAMLMFRHLKPEENKFYQIMLEQDDPNEDKDESARYTIPDDAHITAFKIIKNRRGSGKDKVFAVQSNLDLNRWHYSGELCRKYGSRGTKIA